jgi:23S rRNA (cytidine1920-2'-O)/16S rRNA (cytidine1409-2'-O)-methyltransferase
MLWMQRGVRAARDGRLDHWLVSHGHAATRTEAQAVIMAGLVTVDGQVADKPGRRITDRMHVNVRCRDEPYASRGGVKLARALEVFGIDVRGKVAADLGASTGGFTDCLLRGGAARVYAVDVGRGQLSWRLRTDPRVVSLEGTNARHLTPAQTGGPCDIVTIDLAFISLRLVWRPAAGLLADGGSVVALVKPQFEAGREKVKRGGVVRDPAVHRDVLGTVIDAARAAGLVPRGVVPSPILGPAGNVEFLVHLVRGSDARLPDGALDTAVAQAHALKPDRRRQP